MSAIKKIIGNNYSRIFFKIALAVLLFICIVTFVNKVFADKFSGDGFYLEYPKYWKAVKKARLTLFFPPRENKVDVTVKWEDLRAYGLDFLDYVGISITDVEQAAAGARLISNTKGFINGKSAFTALLESKKLKYKQAYILDYPRAYVITYTAPKKDFDKYLREANRMISSFHAE